ncbi:arginyl-tRNA synthetase [Trichodesmium erythraeum IMS101]|mgnify:CR=1 FL=1|uniref:Arginine--tRNA ligase n=1 Tax=Trichodesmium erythraeum (strain IMS101) TaxID=203124 RepID=SYR_TRIEI|nr:RecName: Full=Arginine--tRNA ligase; AltName: Full=Arginyl-tRNA synthetase; Short=ArgRS [Trichodesmium erythraeum IMS101]MBS9769725.1 arginine--tRNA ligase [Trichodesmium erythraeum GBRTRLIN201]MCL2927530.1 arginine--tRNA ligase [Trichodesmium sp. MAG_R01]
MEPIVEQLKSRFDKALITAFGQDLVGTDPMIVSTTNPKFGDYQCNVAMSLAKKLKDKPKAIATQIINNLNINDYFYPPEIAGPGFINLSLKPEYIENCLETIIKDEKLNISPTKNPQRVVIDFSSPNIAKEMHVGHLRSTIIGDSLARVLEFQGHNVLRLNHVGDWGTQFGMLISYLREAFPEALKTADILDIGDLVAFYKQSKKRFDEDQDFQEKSRQEVVNLQTGAEDSRHAWELLCNQSRREFQVIYDLLDIKLNERGESFYNSMLPGIVEELNRLGLLEESDGAQCVFLSGFTNKEGEDVPLIVKKSDGGYNYATTDLAALVHRIEKEGATRLIYVTDAGQANHFSQVWQVAKKAGWIPENVEIVNVFFGLVLGEDGKKLKTRSGETVRLIDLLDEAINKARNDLEKRLKDEKRLESEEFIKNVAQVVGLSAVKYADLSQNRKSNYVFSFDKMLALQGNTAPYLLYAYVRVQGISRKGEINFEKLRKDAKIILQDEPELVLGKHLLKLNEVLNIVTIELLPNRLCEYLYELSEKFNKFFENCPVLKSEEPLRTSRLLLCDLTARTLKLGLYLLGISVLERM